MRPVELHPACPDGPVLVYALSGLGKSTLAAQYPKGVLDADHLLYAAVAAGFPNLEHRAGLRAWRQLCRQRPWEKAGADLARWASIRRGWTEPFVAAMREGSFRLVVTSLRDPPWAVAAFYGVERGRYLEHLRHANRPADNLQDEAMNARLEGYTPLVRLPPGSFLGDRPEIRALVEGDP
ncbi:MAG: hypothetical protein H6704_31580 [Myxococcales bacterium]|nr:hypothetical protein [Myxococcales bacterium]